MRRLLRRVAFGAICHLAVTVFYLVPAMAADDHEPGLTQVAPGLYVHRGRQETSDEANHGDIANNGFIIGDRCVAVIDTGGSLKVGRELLQALRGVTPLPVCYVINTHVHPDHIFGNVAFRELKPAPVFVGHAHLPAALAARGENYRRALLRDVGSAATGSEVVPPTLLVKDRLDLDLGGRNLQLRAWPTAHTDNDLTIFDSTSGTLWLSDLLFDGHTPVIDGSLRGWLAVLAEIARMSPNQVITGHGNPADWRRALADEERYLRTVLTETRAAIKAGRAMSVAVAEVGNGERDRWLLFEAFHRRNVTAAYAELEWED